jgi:cardiolipin synthase
MIATRKTEQALLQVIDAAKLRLFITSFVAYDIASIMTALERAIERGVQVSMLLEASDKHGGGVSIDAIGKMKSALPSAQLFSWIKKGDGFSGGKVHAKVAVADDNFCFISSANLTGHAMERNMEAGVLIRGGATPRSLHMHLEALETTRVISKV